MRAQQALTDRGAVFELPGGEPLESPDPSLPERLDALANGAGLLLTASLVTAVGIVVRLVATYAVARTGGSVTGFQPCDVLPDDPDDPDHLNEPDDGPPP